MAGLQTGPEIEEGPSPRCGGDSVRPMTDGSTEESVVVAVADGFVEAMEDGRRSGYYVRLRHADGWVTWYIHLNNDTPGTDDGAGGPEAAFAPGLEVGDFVAAGDVIVDIVVVVGGVISGAVSGDAGPVDADALTPQSPHPYSCRYRIVAGSVRRASESS